MDLKKCPLQHQLLCIGPSLICEVLVKLMGVGVKPGKEIEEM